MSGLIASAAILAGGESRRMGFDKALLTTEDGRSSLLLLADSLSARFSDVFIVRRRGLYEESPLPPDFRAVYDDMDEPGPMTGLVSALANSSSEYVFVCACDCQPVMPAYIELITDCVKAGRHDAVLPRVGGFVQPFWSLYNTRLLRDARDEAASKRQSPFRFIRNRDIHIVEESVIISAGIPVSMFSNRNE